jgi:hypothetical protein
MGKKVAIPYAGESKIGYPIFFIFSSLTKKETVWLAKMEGISLCVKKYLTTLRELV